MAKIIIMDNIKNISTKKTGELFSAISHLVGASFGIVGLIMLILKTTEKTFSTLLPPIIYASGLIILYTFSTLYHFFPQGKPKKVLRVFDHISIYIFIAASYTPICLLSLKGVMGNIILIIIWLCALVGLVSKITMTGKKPILSTIVYVAMSWIIVFAIKPMLEVFSYKMIFWLFLGGISYTLGALIYAIGKKLGSKMQFFTHDIFHIFVIGGSLFHYWFIYSYVVV